LLGILRLLTKKDKTWINKYTYKILERLLVLIKFEGKLSKCLHDFFNIGFKANLNLFMFTINLNDLLPDFLENIKFTFLIINDQIQLY